MSFSLADDVKEVDQKFAMFSVLINCLINIHINSVEICVAHISSNTSTNKHHFIQSEYKLLLLM
jgi:hypothetical protein